LSRNTRTQTFIKLNAAVHELSAVHYISDNSRLW